MAFMGMVKVPPFRHGDSLLVSEESAPANAPNLRALLGDEVADRVVAALRFTAVATSKAGATWNTRAFYEAVARRFE